MFTGIVETTATVTAIQSENGCKHFTIMPHTPFTALTIGESIAVNGVCLTVTQFNANTFNVTAVPETLRLTNLDALMIDHSVNLERSLAANGKLGGHFVQGHVDGIGRIIAITPDQGAAKLIKISIPPQLAKYIVNKGYIALDGMSITVIQANADWFTLTLIPHTQAVTIAKDWREGSNINIEVDMLAKYVEKLVGANVYANSH